MARLVALVADRGTACLACGADKCPSSPCAAAAAAQGAAPSAALVRPQEGEAGRVPGGAVRGLRALEERAPGVGGRAGCQAAARQPVHRAHRRRAVATAAIVGLPRLPTPAAPGAAHAACARAAAAVGG